MNNIYQKKKKKYQKHFIFLTAFFIKIIDDFYDEKIYSKKIVNISTVLGIISLFLCYDNNIFNCMVHLSLLEIIKSYLLKNNGLDIELWKIPAFYFIGRYFYNLKKFPKHKRLTHIKSFKWGVVLGSFIIIHIEDYYNFSLFQKSMFGLLLLKFSKKMILKKRPHLVYYTLLADGYFFGRLIGSIKQYTTQKLKLK